MEGTELVQFTGCVDSRPAHGKKILRSVCRGHVCPALVMRWIKEMIPEVIAEQFYCLCPVTLLTSALHLTRQRRVSYFYHCHCANPSSLQCKAAGKCIVVMFKHFPVEMYDSYSLITVPICCNTWLCCPFIYLGGFKCGKFHGYWFMGNTFVFQNTDIELIRPFLGGVVLHINHSVMISCVECQCDEPLTTCRKKMTLFYNTVRLTNACSYAFSVIESTTWTASVTD